EELAAIADRRSAGDRHALADDDRGALDAAVAQDADRRGLGVPLDELPVLLDLEDDPAVRVAPGDRLDHAGDLDRPARVEDSYLAVVRERRRRREERD